MKLRTMSFAVLATCLVIAIVLLHHNSLANSRSAVKDDHSAVMPVDDSPLEVEVLSLDRRGFEPAEIRRPMGRFMLAFTNRTEDQQLTLEINRLAGERAREVNMNRGRPRSLEDLDLPVGESMLSVTNHPEWTCRIVISPR